MRFSNLKRYEHGDLIILSLGEHSEAALKFLHDKAGLNHIRNGYYWGSHDYMGIRETLDKYRQNNRDEVFNSEGDFTSWGLEVEALYKVQAVFSKESLEQFKADVAAL